MKTLKEYIESQKYYYPQDDWQTLKSFLEVNKINEATKYYKWRKKNMKPNIFNYATGELTNDAMICWMLDWASSNDERYKNLSQDILRLFTDNKYLFVDFINIKKQYKNIDILVEVNDSEVIVIEDKVYTSHHSNQLIKYMEIIENDEILFGLEKYYPDNENVKDDRFYLAKTDFPKMIGYSEELQMNDSVYIGIRKVSKGAAYENSMRENFNEDWEILKQIISDLSV